MIRLELGSTRIKIVTFRTFRRLGSLGAKIGTNLVVEAIGF